MTTMKYVTAFQATPRPIWQVYLRPAANVNRQSRISVRGTVGIASRKFPLRFNNAIDRCSRHHAIYNRRITTLLSTDQDDGHNDEPDGFQRYNKPPNKRRRKRDPIMDSINKDTNVPLALIESSAGFLFKRISLPSIAILQGGKDTIDIPLVYILSVLGSVAIVPFVTWILLTAFFGIYLALGKVFINEDENDYNNQFETEVEDNYNGIIPLAAFTGAIASAVLVSPEGLVSNTLFSLASPVAIIALGLGGIAIFTGVIDSRKDEVIFEEHDAREEIIREEMRQMDLWDKEIQRSYNGTTQSQDEQDGL
jgi:hypothetical protein